jgi:hypothetical protein
MERRRAILANAWLVAFHQANKGHLNAIFLQDVRQKASHITNKTADGTRK